MRTITQAHETLPTARIVDCESQCCFKTPCEGCCAGLAYPTLLNAAKSAMSRLESEKPPEKIGRLYGAITAARKELGRGLEFVGKITTVVPQAVEDEEVIEAIEVKE